MSRNKSQSKSLLFWAFKQATVETKQNNLGICFEVREEEEEEEKIQLGLVFVFCV